MFWLTVNNCTFGSMSFCIIVETARDNIFVIIYTETKDLM